MQLLANGQAKAQAFLLELVAAVPPAISRVAPLLATIVIYWIAGLAIAYAVGLPMDATVTAYLPTFLRLMPIALVMLVVGRGFQIVAFERPQRPLTQLLREIRTVMVTPGRIAHALPLLFGILVFGGTFTVVKASIPLLTSYNWDVTFEQWDRWLHGGLAPWQIIHPVVGLPLVTKGIDWIYSSWFYVMSAIWTWQAFSQRDDRLRLQFFFSLFLAWIFLGSVGAIVFASVGPVYYSDLTGHADPFRSLTAYLIETNHTHPIFALTTQKYLWDSFVFGKLTVGAGVSAMPSMHVAIATLAALVCWRKNRWAGILMTIYAVIIMIGSVHLGWHYAIDGYAGALGMIVIWWIVGLVLARGSERHPGGLVTDPA
jgi:hypothetical protein